MHLYRFITLRPGDTVKFKNGSKFNYNIDCTEGAISPNETQRITLTNYEDPDCEANNATLPQFSLYKITDNESLWERYPGKPNVWFIDFSNKDKLYKGYRGNLDYRQEALTNDDKRNYNNIGYIYDPVQDKIYGNRKDFIDQLSQELDFFCEYNETSGVYRTCVYSQENPSKGNRVLYFTDGRDLLNLTSNLNVTNLHFYLSGGHAMSNNVYEFKCNFLPEFNSNYTKNITISNCIIDQMGGSYDSQGYRAGNGIECMTHGENIEITGNKISNCYDTAITLQGNNGNWCDVTISNNTFISNNQSFEVWSSVNDELPHQMQNVIFEHNRCINQGRGWGDETRPDREKSCDIEIQHMDISDAHITINDNEFINPKRLMYLNLSQDRYVQGFKENITLTNNKLYFREDTKIAYICLRDSQGEPYSAGDFNAFAAEYSTNTGDKQTGNIVIGPSNLRVSRLADQSSGGTISGLDPNKRYEYKLRNATEYTPVDEGSIEIVDLQPGIYDIRCLEDSNRSESFVITVRKKSIYNITGYDMGLDSNQRYEYKLTGATEYTPVDRGAVAILDVQPGTYDIRCENTNDIRTVTVSEKPSFNDYITSEDMAKASNQDIVNSNNYVLNPDQYAVNFSNEERIKRVIKKATETNEPIKILLIGGSITFGYSSRSYRPIKNESYGIQFTRWLRKLFPNQEIKTYDIGIPSSDSVLANARIDDELERYNPDIVFVDFAVNDNDYEWDSDHYASLLRKILNYRTMPAVMLPMFSIFDHQYLGAKNENGEYLEKYTVSEPVHCQIGKAYKLPMMRYGEVMKSVLARIGDDKEETYQFVKALGYDYDREIQRENDERENDGSYTRRYPGETVHPGDEGHRMMAQLFEDYFEKVYNEYLNSGGIIDESKLAFDAQGRKYNDEILLNADTIRTTTSVLNANTARTTSSVLNANTIRMANGVLNVDTARTTSGALSASAIPMAATLHVEDTPIENETEGQPIVVVNNFTWYRVVPGKCADPYLDDISDNSGGTFIECDALPCWESRTVDSSLTFKNINGKCIGVWCYYHLKVQMDNIPQHYKDMVQGTVHIELTDSDGNVMTVEQEMPNPSTDPSAHAIYIELYNSDVNKEFKEITIKPSAANLSLGQNPNIQILGLAVSGRE